MRRWKAGVVFLAVTLPAAAPQPPGPALTASHSPVGCVMAGKYPKLTACFTPRDAVASARVYFRAKSPQWYYVDMKPEAACVTGVLPKPRKSLAEMSYYIEALDRSFKSVRTAETLARVVAGASDCRTDAPLAGWVDSAAVTVVAPSGAPALPAGFSLGGGLPATGLVLGGVAAAGGGTALALASGNGGEEPPNTTPTPGPAPTTAPAATATPTSPSSANRPPTLSCRITPSSGRGNAPLAVELNLCATTDADDDRLAFSFDFGDGTRASGFCRETHTYSPSGSADYTARACVNDGRGDDQCCSFPIRVEVPSTPRPGPYLVGWQRRATWATTLDLSGATGQVVVNGSTVAFPLAGTSHATFPVKVQNRVEGVVVNASGRPGTWSFDLDAAGDGDLRAGTIQVVTGKVALLTERRVVFRLSGRRGERIAFTFQARD